MFGADDARLSNAVGEIRKEQRAVADEEYVGSVIAPKVIDFLDGAIQSLALDGYSRCNLTIDMQQDKRFFCFGHTVGDSIFVQIYCPTKHDASRRGKKAAVFDPKQSFVLLDEMIRGELRRAGFRIEPEVTQPDEYGICYRSGDTPGQMTISWERIGK